MSGALQLLSVPSNRLKRRRTRMMRTSRNILSDGMPRSSASLLNIREMMLTATAAAEEEKEQQQKEQEERRSSRRRGGGTGGGGRGVKRRELKSTQILMAVMVMMLTTTAAAAKCVCVRARARMRECAFVCKLSSMIMMIICSWKGIDHSRKPHSLPATTRKSKMLTNSRKKCQQYCVLLTWFRV